MILAIFKQQCFMPHFRKLLVVITCFFLANIFLLADSLVCFATVEPFPHYPSLTKNVEFWKKVYTEFPSTKGFVHDSHDLSVIYDVVDLIDSEKPGARKMNRKRIKKAKEKYKKIILDLASGKKPKTKEGKKVLSLWGAKVSAKQLKDAAENMRFQHCISERFREGLERSGRHLDDIRKIFQDNGLPVDLVFLPHVESSFNYEAYSKFGAAGIWQFIRSTGKRFLRIDYTVDERRDPIIATHAAASYLKENYQKLGSWPLAMTAYNHGANGMARAKKQCGDFETILRDYKGRSFGFASRNFYAQFLAAREIAKDYPKYFDNIRMESATKAKTVQLPGYFALDDLVNHFGVEVSAVRSLNPALRKPVFKGEKYIPKGYEMRFPIVPNFVEMIKRIPANIVKKEQKRSRFYRVSRGDTAGIIANRHKVKLQDLIDSNNLDRRARIFVGQNLVIPVPGEKNIQTASLAPQSSKQRPSGYPPGNKKKADSPVVKAIAKNSKKNVRQKSGVELVEKQQTGEMNTAVILAESTEVTVPLPAQEKVSQPESTIVVEEKAVEVASSDTLSGTAVILGDFQVEQVGEQGGSKVGVIRVEAWETLGHYADWLEVPTSRIRYLNKFAFGRQIKTSQKMKIPLTNVAKDRFEERRYEFHKGIEEDFFAAFKVVETQTYTVRRGDTVWAICHEELDLPFWLIKKYNSRITFDELRPDQVLVVPVVEKTG